MCDLVFTVSHFHIGIEGKCGWIIGYWGAKRLCWLPPLPPKLFGGGGEGGGALPTPMFYKKLTIKS